MNICRDRLYALQLSCPRVGQLVQLARDHGTVGAKPTGGGGSVSALCTDSGRNVVQAMQLAGYQAMEVAFD